VTVPHFPHTRVSSVARWSNYHGTIRDRAIPLVVVPDMPSEIDPDAPPKLWRLGEALSRIVTHAIREQKTLRVAGSRWSLSNVIEPGAILLDSAYMNEVLKVPSAWLTKEYVQARSAKGFVPIFVQGGATIHSLNKSLGDFGLALRTSGASDGQRIAGAIATGTHGSAIDFGAMHDALLAVHLVVAGDKALVVMPKTKPAMSSVVGYWLDAMTGIPTETVFDDDAFAAVQVSLGSLGVVHAVVLEAEKLYGLRRRVVPFEFEDARLRKAIETLETLPLHPDRPERPFHFEVVLSPYPAPGRAAFVVLMWKEDAEPPPIAPPPRDPELSVDLFDFIGALNGIIRGPVGGLVIEALVNELLRQRYQERDDDPRFPGEVFGPTTLPPGNGTSTEIAVPHENTLAMLSAIYGAIRAEAAEGRHHLGAFGVRFVPQPRGRGALLGMSHYGMTTHIEMGAIQSTDAMKIFDRCWKALDEARIPFTCHWGQQGGHTPARVRRYFGDNVKKWRSARRAMLTKAARGVFASPILASVGLD
jgi:FAD/FMN-containing dehydrogenase